MGLKDRLGKKGDGGLTFTEIPNFFFDVIEKLLSDGENRLYSRLFRYSLGWQRDVVGYNKHSREISPERIAEDTGRSPQTIKNNLEELAKYRLITMESAKIFDKMAKCTELRITMNVPEEIDLDGLRNRQALKQSKQSDQTLAARQARSAKKPMFNIEKTNVEH